MLRYKSLYRECERVEETFANVFCKCHTERKESAPTAFEVYVPTKYSQLHITNRTSTLLI
jgi:hypothetical protein